MRRVVVTGIGLLTPMGWGVDATWKGILAGKSAAGRISGWDPTGFNCEVSCEVPRVDGRGGGSADDPASFDPDKVMTARERRRIDEFILYGIAAADEAIADSGWKPETDADREATGVIIGSGIGGLGTVVDAAVYMHEGNSRKVSPFFITSSLINLASGQVSIRHGLRGPNHSVVTACATGAHAIGDAARLIEHGDADVMVAGGTEACVVPMAIAGFVACRALSTNFNDAPEKASRPYDKDRDGFVMGEGAGVLVLEEYEHAKARGAKIYAEIAGYGLAGDGYHITAPPPDGSGGFRAMTSALRNAKLKPEDIDYINAHGTSTPLGDEIELGAVERLLGSAASKVKMSSTKSALGHLLGAAGAVEAALTVLAIRDQIAPPTINLDNPSVETALDLVPHEAKPMKIDVALSNSFGFGGTNASLAFKKVS